MAPSSKLVRNKQTNNNSNRFSFGHKTEAYEVNPIVLLKPKSYPILRVGMNVTEVNFSAKSICSAKICCF